jgi:ribonucleoside-diphosphate reductase beta chain
MRLEKRKLYDVTAPNASTGIIGGKSSNVLNWDDVRYPWAYPKYKVMLGNFWTPFEINMSNDIKQFPKLSKDEQFAFKRIIGLLAFLDSIQTDYCQHVGNYLTDSSLSALMATIAFQEVVHNQSYSYVLSSLVSKDEQDEIFEYWKHDPVLRERNDFIAENYNKFVMEPTVENFIKSLVFDVILEGLNFYSGFAFFYNLARNQKMVATSTMINYINRDEQIHVDVFCKIFQEALTENQVSFDVEEFVTEAFQKAGELEANWGRYIIGNKMDGILMRELEDIKFTANRRVKQLGFDTKPFPDAPRKNPLPWILAYQEVDLGKTDFFEQKSRQYTKVSDDNGFDEL